MSTKTTTYRFNDTQSRRRQIGKNPFRRRDSKRPSDPVESMKTMELMIINSIISINYYIHMEESNG